MAYEYELDEWRAAVAASSEMDRAHDEPDADDNNIGNQPGGYMDPATLCKELERQVENRRIIAGYIKLAEQQHSHDEQELQAARRARRDRIRPQQRRELLGR